MVAIAITITGASTVTHARYRWFLLREEQREQQKKPPVLLAAFHVPQGHNVSFLKEYCDPRNTLVFRSHDSQQAYSNYCSYVQDQSNAIAQPEPYIPFAFTIRVLLDEQPLDNKCWFLKTDGQFVRFIPNDGTYTLDMQEIAIRLAPEGLYLNGQLVGPLLIMRATKGYTHFDGHEYPGVFVIVQKNERAYLINQLDIEDYLYCVLRWESWPGWPLEVNKAFAIACRSYVIAKAAQAMQRNRLYHIKRSNLHQTYNGMHQYDVLRQAIQETQGLILTYNKKPIEAMFDCCCGGVIPAKMDGVNFKHAPYLARTTECTFCKPCKIYRWKITLEVRELQKLLADGGYHLHDIREIKVLKTDRAGIVQQVMVRDKRHRYTITGKKFYSLLSSIKSFAYTIEKKGNTITFLGKGYGHHLGICQWGARNMLNAGWSHRKILAFYYPQTTIMELKTAVKNNAKL